MRVKKITCLRFLMILIFTGSPATFTQTVASGDLSPWKLSVQYLGLTCHPDGGATPELYPLKFDPHAFLVVNIGAMAKADYPLGRYFFGRFATGAYFDCAVLPAGCIHAGPRIQYSLGKNSVNLGIGPIFSFRRDWHRFAQFKDDDFYGRRVYKGWQYRLFPTALELEYLRRISESVELQSSIIPGAPLILTFMFGVRVTVKNFLPADPDFGDHP